MSDAKHLVPFAQRSPARGLSRGDPFLPLINAAYLLLTFFLLVLALRTGAEIADQGGAVTLRVEANGVLHFEGRTMTVSEAVAAIRGALDAARRGPLNIQADRSAPASIILPLLRKLQEGGIASIRLVPVPRLGPS